MDSFPGWCQLDQNRDAVGVQAVRVGDVADVVAFVFRGHVVAGILRYREGFGIGGSLAGNDDFVAHVAFGVELDDPQVLSFSRSVGEIHIGTRLC